MVNNWAYGVITFCGITVGILTVAIIRVADKRKSKKKEKE